MRQQNYIGADPRCEHAEIISRYIPRRKIPRHYSPWENVPPNLLSSDRFRPLLFLRLTQYSPSLQTTKGSKSGYKGAACQLRQWFGWLETISRSNIAVSDNRLVACSNWKLWRDLFVDYGDRGSTRCLHDARFLGKKAKTTTQCCYSSCCIFFWKFLALNSCSASFPRSNKWMQQTSHVTGPVLVPRVIPREFALCPTPNRASAFDRQPSVNYCA